MIGAISRRDGSRAASAASGRRSSLRSGRRPTPPGLLAALLICGAAWAQTESRPAGDGLVKDLPPKAIVGDDTVIEESATLRIDVAPIADAAGDGVLLIRGNDITVDFAGQVLNGATADAAPSDFRGIGVRITGRNVTLRNAIVTGYRSAIWASGADGLTIELSDVSGNFRQRLGSTPMAEDGNDWLWPHQNDGNEWLTRYGAGIYVEDAQNVTIRRCRARRGQNGIVLDRVRAARVYDNDFSFLSGWGLAMWRCEKSIISRNAFDFCVRGYSHGVYNRGQDSAGILFFEQNNDNLIVENSATHGGDGFFGFGGREALGETPAPTADFSYAARGNRGNLIANNDFSYAVAHGIELTFSFRNRIVGNRLVGNAICGIWGGYSQDTLIAGNLFEANGDMGYGLERGGVNIEHGRNNVIRNNTFLNNKVGVHLWWDNDEALLKTPWAAANRPDSADNLLVANRFSGDEVGLHLRETKNTRIGGNEFAKVGREIDAAAGSEPISVDLEETERRFEMPKYEALGEKRAVGARPGARGREKIIMTEWGPYDFQQPYMQRLTSFPDGDVYRLLGREPFVMFEVYGDVTASIVTPEDNPKVAVVPDVLGAVRPYRLVGRTREAAVGQTGVIIGAPWQVSFWKSEIDPRQDDSAWKSPRAGRVSASVPKLDLKFGHGGPSDLTGVAPAIAKAKLPKDDFSTLATTKLTFPEGRWRARITSDDGVRFRIGEQKLLDDWTHHAPKTDVVEWSTSAGETLELRLEHFELDGYAALSLEIEPVSWPTDLRKREVRPEFEINLPE